MALKLVEFESNIVFLKVLKMLSLTIKKKKLLEIIMLFFKRLNLFYTAKI